MDEIDNKILQIVQDNPGLTFYKIWFILSIGTTETISRRIKNLYFDGFVTIDKTQKGLQKCHAVTITNTGIQELNQ